MKKMIICGLVFLSALAFNDAKSQVRVNVNFNIGAQPVWGPVGYDYVEYYYLPDIDVYYYVPSKQFVYLSGGRWTFSAYLPPAYRNYDLYSGYKVVVNQPRAYRYHARHRAEYARYRGHHNQAIIRNSHNRKYDVIRGHSKHGGDRNRDRGHGKHNH